MSTRSNIGIINEDGLTVDYIYCHFDGYPSGVGATLKAHYQSTEKIRNLINGGGISYLGKEVPSQDLKDFVAKIKVKLIEYNMKPTDINDLVYNNFDKIDVTCSYAMWRGEEVEVTNVPFAQYMTEFDTMIEYRYLWDGSSWMMVGDIE